MDLNRVFFFKPLVKFFLLENLVFVYCSLESLSAFNSLLSFESHEHRAGSSQFSERVVLKLVDSVFALPLLIPLLRFDVTSALSQQVYHFAVLKSHGRHCNLHCVFVVFKFKMRCPAQSPLHLLLHPVLEALQLAEVDAVFLLRLLNPFVHLLFKVVFVKIGVQVKLDRVVASRHGLDVPVDVGVLRDLSHEIVPVNDKQGNEHTRTAKNQCVLYTGTKLIVRHEAAHLHVHNSIFIKARGFISLTRGNGDVTRQVIELARFFTLAFRSGLLPKNGFIHIALAHLQGGLLNCSAISIHLSVLWNETHVENIGA